MQLNSISYLFILFITTICCQPTTLSYLYSNNGYDTLNISTVSLPDGQPISTYNFVLTSNQILRNGPYSILNFANDAFTVLIDVIQWSGDSFELIYIDQEGEFNSSTFLNDFENIDYSQSSIGFDPINNSLFIVGNTEKGIGYTYYANFASPTYELNKLESPLVNLKNTYGSYDASSGIYYVLASTHQSEYYVLPIKFGSKESNKPVLLENYAPGQVETLFNVLNGIVYITSFTQTNFTIYTFDSQSGTLTEIYNQKKDGVTNYNNNFMFCQGTVSYFSQNTKSDYTLNILNLSTFEITEVQNLPFYDIVNFPTYIQ